MLQHPLSPVSDEKIKRLAETVRNKALLLPHKKVTAGFDGFVDSIVKVVERREEGQWPVYFSTIADFGAYILSKKSTSFSIETETRTTKIGGNMPIMANAMGQLGIEINCLGAFGYPALHPKFRSMPPACLPFSFAQPGTATALEFSDGKIMMADMADLHHTDWPTIKSRIPISTIINLYAASDMIALLNWSEIDASTAIWKGILQDVLNEYDAKKQFTFIDLSDCSKRSKKSIREALDLVNEFGIRSRVTLSLNRNEAAILFTTLTGKTGEDRVHELARSIFNAIQVESVVVHTSKEVTAINQKEQISLPTFFVKDPLLSTGAGDNFNAGFCAGLLLELDIESALLFANATSGYYVRNGKSGQLNEIIYFLEHINSY